MKDYPRIASALYCQPWAILEDVHASLCEQFEAHRKVQALAPPEKVEKTEKGALLREPRGAADDPVGPCWRDDDGKLQSWHPQVEVVGSTAILRVTGILGKHLSTLAMWCGGVDYALIDQQARNVANDPLIENFVLVLDSPGGQCVGCLETAEAIRAISTAGKSTLAYTDSTCASAAYFLASACDAFVAAPSAIVGSISTISTAVDASRAYEQEGLERLVFRTGRVKAIGQPGERWTDEFKAEMQRVSDDFGAQFKGFVGERRGLADDLMQGQYWPAAAAPEGIVDETVVDLDSLLARIV